MSWVQEQKKRFLATERAEVKVDGFPTFYVAPMTITHAMRINEETDEMRRLARIVQIRARLENGEFLIPHAEFDDFCSHTPAEIVAAACAAINETDSSEAEVEKN